MVVQELDKVDKHYELIVTEDDDGERLDRFLTAHLGDYSRSTLQRWIKDERVFINGQIGRSSIRLKQGANIVVYPAPPPISKAIPQNIPLTVIYEDEFLLVVNKPAGLVVHPAPGHPDHTLVNALRFHIKLPDDGEGERPGIVHRLDKDTSGVLVVAKRASARDFLVDLFKKHQIERQYKALVVGHPPSHVVYNTLHHRHPTDRKRFTCRTDKGKPAITHVRLEERLYGTSLISCRLETGRTHQIRVHLSEHGYPVMGDKLYCRSVKDDRIKEATQLIGRQALHAAVLGFNHPKTGEFLLFETPLPDEFNRAIAILRM